MQQPPIPNYSLDIFDGVEDVFFLYHRMEARVPIDQPFRRTFFAVGICIRGKATLKVNLEDYEVNPGCIVAKPPHVIHQWTYMSDDFQTLTVFFNRDYISAENTRLLDQFQFLESEATYVFPIEKNRAREIEATFNLIFEKYNSQQKYRKEVVRSQIQGLLFEISSLYDDQQKRYPSPVSRGQKLVSDFKSLIHQHLTKEKKVDFYAEQLCISPKYLTEVTKQETGKTASQWIAEALILESKILLAQSDLNIAQVADTLHFPTQASFGRFFKKSTGESPSHYKKRF